MRASPYIHVIGTAVAAAGARTAPAGPPPANTAGASFVDGGTSSTTATSFVDGGTSSTTPTSYLEAGTS